jgi:phytoene dehydrogenase-like protein
MGFSFELGMHDIVNGKHSRMVHILDSLGMPIEVVPIRACGFWEGGQLFPMTRGSMPWMDGDEYQEVRLIIAGMVKMPIAEVQSYNRVSLLDYLKPRTSNPKVLNFFDILGAFTVGMNSARELSVGEFILTTRMPMAARLHFADGTLGQMGGESFMQMAFNLVEIIKANDGDVRLASPVQSIMIEDGIATGVLLNGDGNSSLIAADTVVCNIPIKLALRTGVLPETKLPAAFVLKAKSMRSGGAFVPMFGLSKSVIDIPGMLMTKVQVDDPLLPDGIVLGYEAHSLFVGGKAPVGKEIIECWVGLSSVDLRELKETGRTRVLCDAILDFMKKSHPGFEQALEWALFPVVEHVISVTPTPEQAWDGMLDPACPGVEGLYFVGDGVKNYGGFMDGTAYTALLCADAITGGHYMKDILPPYQREV